MKISSVKEIANTIRGRRLELGHSQQQLSERIGVSRKWLNEFEAGKTHADMATMVRLLEELGLELRIDKPRPASRSVSDRDRPNLDEILKAHSKRR